MRRRSRCGGIDGAQHLADRAAYRRDRRKDLLQENGHLVLRFLAEGVAYLTRLDDVATMTTWHVMS